MRDKQEFFQRRAENIAGMLLTRRDDLVVRKMDLASGATDLLVDVDSADEASQVFGVRVRPIENAIHTPAEVPNHLAPCSITDVSDAPMPYCAFAITMTERGFFTWIREPVTTRSGARLRTVRQPRWRELDSDALAEIVAAVNAWYEAQRQAQAA